MSGTFNGRIAYASVSPIGGPIGAQIDRQSGDFEYVTSLGAGEFVLSLNADSFINPDEATYVATATGKDGHVAEVWRAACTESAVRVQTRDATGALHSESFDLAILVKPTV